MTALHEFSLSAVRAGLASGELRPSEVVEASLRRIEATEPLIGACITVCAEEARAEALRLEQQAADKAVDFAEQPLWGVPVTLKDLLCTKGVRTTCGSRFLDSFISPYDAHVVAQLKKAGAVIVAKTNMDEFAMGSTTEHSAYGVTRNPWNRECVSGGSSGGAAASVAAMQAYGGLGSDTGGSIRQPAGLCGCVGLKPTYGRVSRYGAVAYGSSFDQVGPLARSVEDCAMLFSAIAGYDPKDAISSTLPPPDLSGLASASDLSGVTLGLPVEYWQDGLSPEVAEACQKAVDTARQLGASVVDVSLPHITYSIAAYYILTCAEASTNLARFDGLRYGERRGNEDDLLDTYVASRSQGFGEEVKRRILLGTYALSAGYYDAYYTKAAQVRRLVQQDFMTALAQCDALLAPACPVTAWKIGSFANDPLTAYKMDVLTLGVNLAGLPGLSLPAGLGSQSGLPVGLQIFGCPFEEATILNIGRALEATLPAIGAPAI